MKLARRYSYALLWLALAGLVVLAAALRLYRLGSLPAGLHFDEAGYGVLGLQIIAGERPVFFSAYAGREAAYPYLVALCTWLFGQTIFAIRLPAALAGVGLVVVVFLLGRKILGRGGALLAAGGTATAPWLLHLSRIGFRSNLVPLATSVWAWLLLRALQGNRYRDWLGAGLILGLTAYTYLSSRFAPILVLLFFSYLALWHKPLLLRCWRGTLLMLGVAGVIATPLVVHFIRVPADWSERMRQVGACAGIATGPCVSRIAAHALATVGMIGVQGDPLRVFNLPGSPALPISIGWLFYLGVLLALHRWRDPAIALLLLWWVVMVLPGILSIDSVSYVRTTGAMTPTLLLWALPLVMLGQGILKRWPKAQPALIAGGTAVIVLMAVLSAYDYFGRWANQPELYYDYMGYATDAALAASAVPPQVDLYISEEYYRHPTYLYLAPRTANAHWFDARYGWPIAPAGHHSIYVISPTTPLDKGITPFLAGSKDRSILNKDHQYAYTWIELPSGSRSTPAPAHELKNTVGGLVLEGMTVGKPVQDNALPVTFFWQVQEPTKRELRIFLHLVDGQGQKVAQHDALGYPSLEWQPGDRFVVFHTIPLPAQLPYGEYRLMLGLYDIYTFERFPTTGQGAKGDALMLPTRIKAGG